MPRPAAAVAPAPTLLPRPPDTAAAAAGDEEQSSSSPTCRICWSGENKSSANKSSANKLVAPCSCKGTCELVHLGCLESWIAASARAGKPPGSRARCELCGDRWKRDVCRALRSLPPRGGSSGGPGGGRGRRRLRAAAADAGSLLSGLARRCALAVAGTARRARSRPPDAALTLYAAVLAARGVVAAGRGARRGAALGVRAASSYVSHSSYCLEVVVAGLCLPRGLRVSRAVRALALTAGAEVLIVTTAALSLGAVAGAVAGAAAGVAGDLCRHASAAERLAGAALSRVASPPRPRSSSSPRSSPPTSSSSSSNAAAAAASTAAAATAATASASSLAALLSPMSSPPLSSPPAPRRRAGGGGGGNVGFGVRDGGGEGGFLSSLAAAFVTAARGRGGIF